MKLIIPSPEKKYQRGWIAAWVRRDAKSSAILLRHDVCDSAGDVDELPDFLLEFNGVIQCKICIPAANASCGFA